MQEQNGYLILEHLSEIELYYTPPEFVENGLINLQGEEYHHAINVMRNSVGGILHITDGQGIIFKTEIIEIKKTKICTAIQEMFKYENRAENIWFCIPQLKNPDRLKFAFEKCVEFGITNFVLYSSKRTISKKNNLEKFHKITLSAMKQSLRAFFPKILSSNFNEIIKSKGQKILFDQNTIAVFNGKLIINEPTYFLFGPEGGFDESEINSVNLDLKFSLSTNRLRSETAVIKCASLLKL